MAQMALHPRPITQSGKPPFGSVLDVDHPLSQALHAGYLCNEVGVPAGNTCHLRDITRNFDIHADSHNADEYGSGSWGPDGPLFNSETTDTDSNLWSLSNVTTEYDGMYDAALGITVAYRMYFDPSVAQNDYGRVCEKATSGLGNGGWSIYRRASDGRLYFMAKGNTRLQWETAMVSAGWYQVLFRVKSGSQEGWDGPSGPTLTNTAAWSGGMAEAPLGVLSGSQLTTRKMECLLDHLFVWGRWISDAEVAQYWEGPYSMVWTPTNRKVFTFKAPTVAPVSRSSLGFMPIIS